MPSDPFSVLTCASVLTVAAMFFARDRLRTVPWGAPRTISRRRSPVAARSLALVAIVIGGLLFMAKRGERQISGIVFRRWAGAVRRAVPRLVVHNVAGFTGGGGMSDRRRISPSTKRCIDHSRSGASTGASSSWRCCWAAAWPVLLLPRRPADVRRAVTALWATRRDPELLRILFASSRVRRRYDPGKHRRVDVEVSAW